jgi:hypothetical protein
MTKAKEDNRFEQVVQKLDPHSKLLHTWKLKGGVSAQVTALEVEQNATFLTHGTDSQAILREQER